MIWNEEQRKAILHRGGPCLVLAGPGSGKTSVIVNRAVELVRSGVPPEQILVLTFTRAAAAEMRERYADSVRDDAYAGVTFSTFHALGYSILKEEGVCDAEALADAREKRELAERTVEGHFPEMSAQDRKRLVRRVLEKDARDAARTADADVPEDPVETPDADVRLLTEEYRRGMRAAGKIDFHDMILGCLDLFERDPVVLRKWQKRYRFVMVDEAQDMSLAQLRTAARIAEGSDDLFIVGDDDQSIYGFRGVSPRSMAELTESRPDTRVITLSVNYRSKPKITDVAALLIEHNHERFRKSIRPARSGGGPAVFFRIYTDETVEAEEIARTIHEACRNGGDPSEIAVLCRTGGQLRKYLRAFSEYGVPYACREDPFRGMEGMIAADLEAFAGLADGLRRRGTWKRRELVRVLGVLDNGLYAAGAGGENVDPETWKTCFSDDPEAAEHAARFIRDVRVLGKLSGEAFGLYLLRAAGYGQRLRRMAEKEGVSAQQAEMLVVSWAERKASGREKSPAAGPSCEKTAKDRGAVRVMTMHAAKGLEFRTVFLPSLNEGVIPHSSAKSRETVEEERRLMYVAVTRAKDELYLSRVRMLHAHRPGPSRFLREMLGNDFET